jgi:hypothetical protein
VPGRGHLLEDEVPADQQQFKALNAELARKWPVITEKGEPPADAKEWEGKTGKTRAAGALIVSADAGRRCGEPAALSDQPLVSSLFKQHVRAACIPAACRRPRVTIAGVPRKPTS